MIGEGPFRSLSKQSICYSGVPLITLQVGLSRVKDGIMIAAFFTSDVQHL